MDGLMPYALTMSRKVIQKDETASTSGTAKVFGANLAALMRVHKELSSNPKLSAKTGLSTSTISRLLNGQVDATLSTIEKLADAFGVSAWQMLVPGMDASNPPVLQFASAREQQLYARFREVAKEFKEIP